MQQHGRGLTTICTPCISSNRSSSATHFPGLNLTFELREGIVKHSRDYTAAEHPELAEYFLDQRPPLEAQLIDLADEIAYDSADLDDGLESGILNLDDVRDRFPFSAVSMKTCAGIPGCATQARNQRSAQHVLNALVTDLIEECAAGGGTGRNTFISPPRPDGSWRSARRWKQRAPHKSISTPTLQLAGMEEEHLRATRSSRSSFKR